MDDDEDLGPYIAANYLQLLTDVERAAWTALMLEQKAADASSPGVAAMLRKRSPGAEPEVRAALSAGATEFWRAVRERLEHDHAAEFRLARCASCSRLLRTPVAEQCLGCGLDWH